MKRKHIESAKHILNDEKVDEESEEGSEEESDDTEDSDGDENVDSDEESDEEESSTSIKKYQDELAATDSESDSDESEIDEEKNASEPKSRADIIKKDVLQRYEERQGKQLYIRFPHKVPNTEYELEKKAKELCPLIAKVHKPRQKHARFCLVDFNSKDDRDAALKKLRNAIQKGELAKYVVNIPRTESIEYVNELAERKIKSVENKKAKARLKKASKKALLDKNTFTPTIVVLNLPKNVSEVKLRELFPNAVDIQIKAGKGRQYKDKSIAAVTLPSTIDARKAAKQKLSLGGYQLIVKFDNQTLKKRSQQKKKHLTNNKQSGTNEPQNKKRKIEANEETQPTKVGNRKSPIKKTKVSKKIVKTKRIK